MTFTSTWWTGRLSTYSVLGLEHVFTCGVPVTARYCSVTQLILEHGFELFDVYKLSFLQVTRLCDLSVEGDLVTSVGWSERVSTHD